MNDANTTSTTKRVIFTDIDPVAIRHPLDQAATDQLKKLRGFDMLVAKYLEFRFERLNYVLNTACDVKVGPKQLPRLYKMLCEGCTVLDMPEPDLYVSQSPVVNAFTFGHTKPSIVLYSGLLDLMDDEEVMAVIAHELGHVKCGHVLYMTMASQIEEVIAYVKDLLPAIGQWIGFGMDLTIKIALINWARRAELSADRSALLVMQNPRSCVSMLMKLAGGTKRLASELDAEEFLRQARTYAEEGDMNVINSFYRLLAGTKEDTRPFAVERAKYLNDWIDSTEYDQILAGNYPRIIRSVQGRRCLNCGRPLDATDKFCPSCGRPVVSQG